MSATDPVTLHLLVTGHVQGVSYRYSMGQQARSAGLRGWVRNLHDGRVEAVVQGPSDAVEALVQWCRRGPSGARVDKLVTAALDDATVLAPFETHPTA